MTRIVRRAIGAFAITATLSVTAGCDSEPFDPVHCDYEQATPAGPVAPVERAEWIDGDGDGVVVLCMWVGLA